jgi:small neutral amino acid transporter SnatA (MarC family)
LQNLIFAIESIESSDKLLGNLMNEAHQIANTRRLNFMYRNRSDRSLFDVAMPAAIGAGVVTSFAIAQGQHPAIAIAITAISTIFAIICHQLDLV